MHVHSTENPFEPHKISDFVVPEYSCVIEIYSGVSVKFEVSGWLEQSYFNQLYQRGA